MVQEVAGRQGGLLMLCRPWPAGHGRLRRGRKKKGKTGSSKEKKRLRKLQALLQGSSSSSEEEDDDDADVDMARVMKLGAMGGARFARLMMRQPGVADFGDLGDQATKRACCASESASWRPCSGHPSGQESS